MSDVNGQQTGWNDRDGGDVQVFELGTAPDFPTSVEIAVANGPIGD
ncbi:YncE family protein, partial [Mycolicibacterium setense]|nr:YncE family protein [Mycolicibacterium setense]